MEDWHRYQPPDLNNPCTNCQVGWGNDSQKVVDGVDYFKCDDCHESCQVLKDFNSPEEEHLFFNNIREAYAVIINRQRSMMKEMAVRGW